MMGAALALAAVVAAGGTGGAYYYFEVYKKQTTTTDASGANTAVLTAPTASASATTSTPAATTPAATTPAATTGSSATAVAYINLAGLDNNGSDVSSSTGTTQLACNAACTANSACNVTEFKSGTGECWLKSGVVPGQINNPASNLGATLGFKNPTVVLGNNAPGVDHPNSDLVSVTVANEQDCRQLGMMAPGAVASVFAPSNNTCWLKSALGGAVSQSDRNTFTFQK